MREEFINLNLNYTELRAKPNNLAHYNYKGNKLIADIIYDFLVQHESISQNQTK